MLASISPNKDLPIHQDLDDSSAIHKPFVCSHFLQLHIHTIILDIASMVEIRYG